MTHKLAKKSISWLLALVVVLSACTAAQNPIQTKPSPQAPAETNKQTTELPTPTETAAATSPSNVDSLLEILYVSDPDLPEYKPESTPYAQFGQALTGLSNMGPAAIDAASYVAHAISFPRQDSNDAAQALISLGPDIAGTTLPVLLDNLKSPRPETRLDSLIVISSIGENASCAVGEIGPLLWDDDPQVRYIAAFSLEKITGNDLLPGDSKATPDPLSPHSIPADTPEGQLVGSAQDWWTTDGSQINWHPAYGVCDP